MESYLLSTVTQGAHQVYYYPLMGPLGLPITRNFPMKEVREYGLLAVNAFGLHHFEKQPEETGDLTITAGEFATFRYRIYMHESDEIQSNVASQDRAYASER